MGLGKKFKKAASKVKKGAGETFDTIMGKTDIKSASLLDPSQRALLTVGTRSIADKLPSTIDVMSKGMTSMDNSYDAAGAAGVLNAMKMNNLAATNRAKALNAQKFQRTGLGRAAADTLSDESLGRLNAEADKWDLANRQGAIENAFGRQQGWAQLMANMYGSSLGNTMENAAIKKPGLPEVAATAADLGSAGKSLGLV